MATNFEIPVNEALVTFEYLMSLADNMASAAVSFNSHGYDNFIESRENFKSSLMEYINSIQK